MSRLPGTRAHLLVATLASFLSASAGAQHVELDESEPMLDRDVEASEARLANEVRALALHVLGDLHHGEQIPEQRECLDLVAARITSLVRFLDEGRATSRASQRSIAAQVDELEEEARMCRAITTETHGEVEVDMRGRFLHPRMRRDRFHLLVGPALVTSPRAPFGEYERVPVPMLRIGVRRYLLSFLRIDLVGMVGYAGSYGTAGGLSVGLKLTAPWSIFRLAFGPTIGAVVNQDRVLRNDFAWLGVEFGFPLEIGFEISKRFGLSTELAILATKPGEEDWAPVGVSFGIQLEIVL